ncbi:hypothetical protein GCM10009802_54910 [Streptomyces synnematoformans]|uniref:Uncharacterized protein n=1 Tax=Streptomyces synnematoformans TaxID=415721 RepID=A0ABP4KB78_9ACTN
MATCKKCGIRKRRWPRSCPRCRAGVDRTDVAVTAVDTGVATGVVGWLGRGVRGIARLLQRAFD